MPGKRCHSLPAQTVTSGPSFAAVAAAARHAVICPWS